MYHFSKWALAAALLGLTACGGGGSMQGGGPAPAGNTAPAIAGLANQTVNQDTATDAMAFTVSDAESGADAVQVTATSSDPELVANDGIAVSGTGANRTVAVTPAEAATGSVNITLTATDPQGLAKSATFGVTVKAVERSMAALTADTMAQDEAGTSTQVNGITVVQDAEDPAVFAAWTPAVEPVP